LESLPTKLAVTGRTAVEEFGLLRFVDDRRAPQCRVGARLAFTRTGSHLIRVCARLFTDWFTRNRKVTEIIRIPNSAAITERVAARCGD